MIEALHPVPVSKPQESSSFLQLRHVGSIGWLLTPSIWAWKRGASFGEAQPTNRQGEKKENVASRHLHFEVLKPDFFFFPVY